MSKQNILITGANGFIGRALVEKLQENQCNVYGLDCKPLIESQKGYFKEYYEQDLTEEFKLESHFDYVFHLAALNVTHVGKADYPAYVKANVLGTENLIKAVESKKFVFMSTAKVYRQVGGRINEESSIQPQGDYEKSKLEAENIFRHYLTPEQVTILRPVNIVGPGQADKAILPLLFKNALTHKPIDIFASRKSVLQLLYIDDVVRAFERIVAQLQACGIFNLSSEETISLENLVSEIMRMTQSQSRVNFSNLSEVPFSEVVSLKAKKVLGWQAQTSVPEILQNCYSAYSHS